MEFPVILIDTWERNGYHHTIGYMKDYPASKVYAYTTYPITSLVVYQEDRKTANRYILNQRSEECSGISFEAPFVADVHGIKLDDSVMRHKDLVQEIASLKEKVIELEADKEMLEGKLAHYEAYSGL